MKEGMKGWLMAGIMAGALVAPGLAVTVNAEDKPEADLSVAAYSQYIWRGFAFSKDSLVLQPSMTVGYKGFGFNLWGNLDTDQYGMDSESFNWNETDLTLSYDGAVGKVAYSAGYIYYDLDGIEDTAEVYLGVSLDTLLAPSFTVYYDIANVPGWYAKLGVSHSIAMGEKLSLDLGASVGYLDDDADYSELHDGVVSAAMPFAVGDYLTVTPELYVSMALSSKAEDLLNGANLGAIGEDESTFVYGGVSASFAF